LLSFSATQEELAARLSSLSLGMAGRSAHSPGPTGPVLCEDSIRQIEASSSRSFFVSQGKVLTWARQSNDIGVEEKAVARMSNAPGITNKKSFVRVEMQSICIYRSVTVPSTKRLSAAPQASSHTRSDDPGLDGATPPGLRGLTAHYFPAGCHMQRLSALSALSAHVFPNGRSGNR
jgi:hypothetical protein